MRSYRKRRRTLFRRTSPRPFRTATATWKAVTAALIQNDEAWTAAPVKLRSPIEFLAATGRLLGQAPVRPSPKASLLAMGQPFLARPVTQGMGRGRRCLGDLGWHQEPDRLGAAMRDVQREPCRYPQTRGRPDRRLFLGRDPARDQAGRKPRTGIGPADAQSGIPAALAGREAMTP